MNLNDWTPLFAEARKNIKLHSEIERFERLRLLDGLDVFLKEDSTNHVGISQLTEILISKFNVDPWETEKARNSYVADDLIESIKKSYAVGQELNPALLGIDLELGYLLPAICNLCKRGFLSEDDLEHFYPTILLWSKEFAEFKIQLSELLENLREFSIVRSGNYEECGREYEGFLHTTVNIIIRLRSLGQRSIADPVIKKCEEEAKHMHDHHPGPWVRKRAQEFRRFLLETVDKLPDNFKSK
jgi:hypothetical protein